MPARTFDRGDFGMMVRKQEREYIREQEEKRIHEEELKNLRNDITILRADVYSILYLLYKFIKKPDAPDFDTFYLNRFKQNITVPCDEEKIYKCME